MKKPYIFGHRGAMSYEIENTLPSFQKAVDIGAGIETDVHLTKDNKLVCFHDPVLQIGSKSYIINKLTLKELEEIKFEDKRKIPILEKIFQTFKNHPETLRYSCDIGNRKVGIELINLVKQYSLLKRFEITDLKRSTLYYLRRHSEDVKLVYSVPYHIPEVNNRTIKLDKLIENNVKALNIKYDRANQKNFKNIIDYGFDCYVWGVNIKSRMKRVLKMRSNDKIVSAIYSNYPDILIGLRDQIYG